MARSPIESERSHVFPLELSRPMPVVTRGEGVWIEDVDGNRYLDAMSGGSMASTLGHGRSDLVAAAVAQAERLAFVHNERLTNPAQEMLAEELTSVAPEGFTRARFTVSGADANEMALQIARSYHVERGEHHRWQVISPAQAYHGPTMQTLALTGRPGMHGPFGPYLPQHLHIPPSTWRFDPTGEAALEALDAAIEEAGPETISTYFCEAISAAALPAYTPPVRFWEGLAERRDRHGFLVCFDEVVTGVGRTGEWFAGAVTACPPDLIATAKGLGAGYAAIGAVLVKEHVYRAFEDGSKRFTLGHTWDGAPLACAVGIAVIDAVRREGLIERVRGHGYLLGVSFVDPRDGASFLPPTLRVGGRIDAAAFDKELIVLSTQPTRDGFAGDQTLFAPAFTASDEDLDEMVSRFAEVVHEVAKDVEPELDRAAPAPSGGAR